MKTVNFHFDKQTWDNIFINRFQMENQHNQKAEKRFYFKINAWHVLKIKHYT